MNSKYEAILHRPHHESINHPRMSRYDRAAQFAPFAALNGYAEAINETARKTESRRELDESEKEILSSRIQYLLEHKEEKIPVTFVYFVQDEVKSGGAYYQKTGVLLKKEDISGMLILDDRTKIRISDISEIRGDVFAQLD